MEAVKAFNAELSSLYEVKPPISKAKMTALTRGAIKAIKFYKHVVQSVEKFILKCKSEYKVPGLYVIDSIVRQSRHQFGSDKDVFAPRFAKNMQQTFVNLFKCPPEDKSKIIRVLNLWQKNQVFAPEVIQPLFDLADPNNPIHKELGTPLQSNGMSQMAKGSPALQKTPTKGPQGLENAHGATSLNLADPNVLAQFQQLQRLLARSGDGSGKGGDQVHFDKKLLDYDYGDDDEEVNPSPRPPASDSVANLLANPEVLRQLQTLQQTIGASDVDIDKMRKLQEMKQQEEEFDKHLAQTVPNLPFASECEFKPNSGMINAYYMPPGTDLSLPPPGYNKDFGAPPPNNGDFGPSKNDGSNDVEVITLDHDDSRSPSPRDDRYSRRRRSRSRDRSRDRRDRDRDRRRRSRSRSKGRRYRSRSRDRDRNRGREKEKETEKDKERKKRGLPAIKKENLSVCSTTLWVGHLSKLVHQEDLSNTFGEFGDIVSIDLIPPRGCAFIVMHRRQDAARCLNKLKSYVLHGKAITLAWAPGKGVKGKDLKDYWEGDLGVSYIPWNKIKEDIDLEMLEDGGMIDEDTMPPWMKAKVANLSKKGSIQLADMSNFMNLEVPTSSAATVDTSQPPPMPGAGLLQPPILPLVSPFQFNNRLLGPPVGMNVPPGIVPNIPLGVPPPNMSQAMMTNQLLGFQGPPSLMHQMPQVQGNDGKGENIPDLMSLAQPYGMIPQPPVGLPPQQHDDNMDVEMEDADKSDKALPLSEQLLVSMGQFNRRSEDRHDDRSRERDRDHRDRERIGSRERNNRDSSRGRERGGRRDRPNRWGDREEPDRKEREKTLNDRLREMAGMPEMPEREPEADRIFHEENGRFIRPDMPPREEFNEYNPRMMRVRMRHELMGPDLIEDPQEHRMMDMEQERFMRGRRFRDDYDRGEYFGMRDNFGPRGPPMRGPGPDFGPRGPPMMRGGHRFPRGMRGPRLGGPRYDSPGFGPRFDGPPGPPDFFRGPRGPPPPGMYDDHPRHRRFEERRFSRGGDFDDRSERRSRWGGENEEASEAKPVEESTENADQSGEPEQSFDNAVSGGNATPLHDEGEVNQNVEEESHVQESESFEEASGVNGVEGNREEPIQENEEFKGDVEAGEPATDQV